MSDVLTNEALVEDLRTGAVAGGRSEGTLTASFDDLNAQGVLRRPVPTARQAESSGRVGDRPQVAEWEAGAPELAEPPTRRQKARAFLSMLNPRTVPGPKFPLMVFALSGLISGWFAQTYQLALPEIQATFGFSVVGVITLMSVMQIMSTLVGLPVGYLVDHVKRVWLVRFYTVSDAIGFLTLSRASGIKSMYGGTALTNLSGASGLISTGGPATVPLLTDYYGSRARGRVVGMLTIGGQVGFLIATGLSGVLIQRAGWQTAMAIIGFAGLGVAVLTFFLREPVRGGIDRLEFGMEVEEAAKEPPAPSFFEAIRAAFAVRTVRLLAIAGMVTAVGIAPLGSVVQLILANKFLLSPEQRSAVAFAAAALSIPVMFVGSALVDRALVRRPKSIAIGISTVMLINAGCTILEAVAPNMWLFVVPQVLSQALVFSTIPAIAAMVSLAVPARIRGVGGQVNTPFALVGSILSPVVASLGNGHSPQAIFLMFTPFFVLGSILLASTAATFGPDIRAARAASAAQDEVERAAGRKEEKILVVRDVDVAYDGVQVLFNVDLDVHRGEVVALVGTNGAGKSTLLRAICGLQQAANGAIFFDGRDVTATPTYESARRGLIYMPGGQGVFPALTVRQNLESALRDEPGASIERALELFPTLRDRLNTQAGKLSGGQQQMVALGQALLMKPSLLMIDELSLGLAPSVIELLLNVIRELQAEGVTVLLVEQSLNVALTIANRAVFMDRGQVQFDGPTEDLLARPDLVRAVFLGGGGSSAGSKRRAPANTDAPQTELEAREVTVSFGGLNVLTDVTFGVAPGEIVGVIGPNGAGKTTLFDVLSGYVKPDSGDVLLRGREVTRLSPDARARVGLGRAFQNARLFPPLTVRENLAVALEKKAAKSTLLAAVWAPPVRRNERRLRELVDGYIELLGLAPYADKFVRELSTGTRRAVEVGCQMAANPNVLLLDEPSSGLAQAETEALGPTLARIVKDTGCAMVVIEHDLPLITSIANRLIAMELGQVIAIGSPDDVTHDPRVLASYLAASHDVIERSGSRVGSVLSAVSAPEEI
ncbi:MAG TPA: MFS transporter [Mycobacteriales bacterium]|nr:MFS transporter [Mycobacteriales bacterium]